MTLPRPAFAHLRRLTDGRALFEHADHETPRPEHGYCVDDNARAVVALCRAADPATDDLLERYLAVVLDAVAEDGRCHNRLGTDGRWQDAPGDGDWWGRAVWALGAAAKYGRLDERAHTAALAGFERLARRRPHFRRTMAYAALGAVEIETSSARSLLADAAEAVRADGLSSRERQSAGRAWPWPEPRLTYANGLLPEALLAAGPALGRPDLTETGLAWLRFLVRTETGRGHLSPTPVAGRGPGERGPAHDQQPIEVAALADACARAYDVTGDREWADAIADAWRWFAGDNDEHVAMYDPDAGAGYDGLVPGGHNANRGAESTLAAVFVLLQARRTGVEHDVEVVRHRDQTLAPDQERVVARLFMPSADAAHGDRALDLVTRVMALPEAEVQRLVGEVLERFTAYHVHLRATLFQHARPLVPRDAVLTEARQILLGAAFTSEYALEGAALCNPSVVPHPDQSDLQPGELRVAVSLRAIGEGHMSALEFVTAVIGDTWRFVPRAEPPVLGTITPASMPRALFSALAREDEQADELTAAVLNLVPAQVRTSHVEDVFDRLPPDLLLHPSAHRRAGVLRRAARSGYYASFDPRTRLDQRVLMPATDDESHGLEDARFTQFRDEQGTLQYRATYTAYDGREIRMRMLTSTDLASFQSQPLSGPGAQNKGLALFPRRIGGRFAALSRHDGRTNGVTLSDDGFVWDTPSAIDKPGAAPWTIRQLGNAGAPLETAEGWLVLSHGVGFMRVYSLGALLLDLDNPARVLARLEQPWLTPAPDHGGYVPNVVFSCGGIIHEGRLFVPYGIGDKRLSVASVSVSELIGAMRREG